MFLLSNKNLKTLFVLTVCSILVITNQARSESGNVTTKCKHSCFDRSIYRKAGYDKNKKELLLKGEFLYWKGTLSNIKESFGNTEIEIKNSENTKITKLEESFKMPDAKWRAGFRVGADFIFDNFDLEADWTHFHGFADYKHHSQHGAWNLHFDQVDLALGHYFYPFSSCYLKPFIGLRIANINQTLKSHLETIKTEPTQETTITTKMHDREKFLGIGPEVGLEANYYLGKNFSLYGMVDAATYYGHVNNKYHDVSSYTNTVNDNNLKQKDWFNSICTDATLGVRWDKYTTCCKHYDMHFLLKLGVEQHRIYNFCNVSSQETDGTLSLDGAVLEAGIGFRF